ncbi:hypothetical protein ACFFYR_07175 [Paraburkholderia dipogonis]
MPCLRAQGPWQYAANARDISAWYFSMMRMPRADRRVLPGLERGVGGTDGFVTSAAVGERHARQHLLRGGIGRCRAHSVVFDSTNSPLISNLTVATAALRSAGKTPSAVGRERPGQ